MALKTSYSLRLPEGEFFPAARKKSGIAIHHTVGGTASSTLEHWLRDRTKAGKGIVNLSRCRPDFADENEYEWLPRLPVSS